MKAESCRESNDALSSGSGERKRPRALDCQRRCPSISCVNQEVQARVITQSKVFLLQKKC